MGNSDIVLYQTISFKFLGKILQMIFFNFIIIGQSELGVLDPYQPVSNKNDHKK
jgi:hypothetical protein